MILSLSLSVFGFFLRGGLGGRFRTDVFSRKGTGLSCKMFVKKNSLRTSECNSS